jgi:nicotinate-nucleotide pyrophosphorylase (carboxylating)
MAENHSPLDNINPEILAGIRRALAEDIGPGDATTEAIVPATEHMSGHIIAKQSGVCAGLDIAAAVYYLVSPEINFVRRVEEGTQVEKGRELARVTGPARALLTGERTALNYLGRISGIATLTASFVASVAGTNAIILDTRKTAPGLRQLDKLAVRRGGGQNHRTGLYDMILIKDNHIDFAGSIQAAVERARAYAGNLEIEVETRTLADVQEALRLDVDRILLDNMPPEVMRQAVKMTAGKAKLEASGNINLANVRQAAECGVDFISIGALTHSAPVFDVSFKYLD